MSAVLTRRVVRVKFPGEQEMRMALEPKLYDYEVPPWFGPEYYPEDSCPIVAGAKVVVDTPFPQPGYVVAEVVEVIDRIDSDWESEFKPIVDVVDDERYLAHLSDEEQADKIEREIKRILPEREGLIALARATSELTDDPEVLRLVEELKRLRGMPSL